MKQTIEEHANMLSDIIYTADLGYAQYEQDFRTLKEIYHGQLPSAISADLQQRGKSHITSKKVKGLVIRGVSSTMSAYYTNPDIGSVKPQSNHPQHIEQARVENKALNFYWSNKIKSYNAFYKAVMQSWIIGTPVTKVFWDNTKQTVVYKDVDISNVRFDPSADSFYESNYFVHIINLTKDQIALLKKQKIFNSKFDVSDIHADTVNTDTVADNTQYKKVELHDVYYKENGTWKVSTIYDNSIVLRRGVDIGRLPFIVGGMLPQIIQEDEIAVRSYYDSPIAVAEDLQMELNLRINQEIDAIALHNNPRYISNTGSGLKEADLKKGAGKIVWVTDRSEIDMIPAPNVAVMVQNQDRLRRDMEEYVGIRLLSNPDNSAVINRQTSAGMNIISNETNVVPDNYIRSFNETYVEPLLKMTLDLIYANAPERWLFEDIDIDLRDPNATAIAINAGIGATSDKIKLEGLNVISERASALGEKDLAIQALKDMMPLLGRRNIHDYFPNEEDPEQKAKMQQQEQMQQQLQQQQIQLELAEKQAKVENLKAQSMGYQMDADSLAKERMANVEVHKAQIQKLMADVKLKQEELTLMREKNDGDISLKHRELDAREAEAMAKAFNGEES